MPLFRFKCKHCGHETTVLLPYKDKYSVFNCDRCYENEMVVLEDL